MKSLNSKYFYDSNRAFYDGGVDYLTTAKHVLVVIAQHASRQLSFLQDEPAALAHSPFSSEQVEADIALLHQKERYFRDAKETWDGEKAQYALDYETELAALDQVLVKYAEFFESEVYQTYKNARLAAFKKAIESGAIKLSEEDGLW